MSTIGDIYGPAMKITNQEEADRYFEKLVLRCQAESDKDRSECEKIQRQNLGYYAGYYSHETRARVEQLFKCAHPIFGSIAENGPPSPRQALAMGIKTGRKMRHAKHP